MTSAVYTTSKNSTISAMIVINRNAVSNASFYFQPKSNWCAYLRISNGSELLVLESLDGLLVLAQIQLGPHQYDGSRRTVMAHLRIPLGPDVLETRRIHQRETDEKDVGLRIGQGPQPVVILLTGRIPEAQVDGLAVHHDVGRVVVEDCGYVLAGEGIGRVADQQTSFTHGSVMKFRWISFLLEQLGEVQLLQHWLHYFENTRNNCLQEPQCISAQAASSTRIPRQ